jgi:hypothetical protein
MTYNLTSLYGRVKQIPVSDAKICAQAGIDQKTLKNTLEGKRRTNESTKRVLSDALQFFLRENIPGTNEAAIEASALASARAEHTIVSSMTLEDGINDALEEMQDTAVSRLFDLVTTRGTRNAHGHKQFNSVVLIGGAPQEITEDGPLEITEARAVELLEVSR